MKSLNKTSVSVFNKLVELLGANDHIKIENTNGVFMAVSFELLQEINFNNQSAKLFALAHYYEQNGDLIPDPDMTFIQIIKQPEIIYPASITTAFGHKQALWKEDGVWKINRKEQADQTSFANMWLKNIKHQQFATDEIEDFASRVISGETTLRKCFPEGLINKKSN